MFKQNAGIKVAVCATMTATLSLGKLSLSWLPNIEIVTLLICVYALVFGVKLTMLSAVAFVCIEGYMYGFMSSWWMAYLIYFPLLPVFSYLINKNRLKWWRVSVFAVIATLCFDVLTVVMDVWFYGATFTVRLISGLYFFAAHIIGNGVIFAVAFIPVYKLLNKIKPDAFAQNSDNGKTINHG